jgi:hypothetical protein
VPMTNNIDGLCQIAIVTLKLCQRRDINVLTFTSNLPNAIDLFILFFLVYKRRGHPVA